MKETWTCDGCARTFDSAASQGVTNTTVEEVQLRARVEKAEAEVQERRAELVKVYRETAGIVSTLTSEVEMLRGALRNIANYTINDPSEFVHQIAIAAVPPTTPATPVWTCRWCKAEIVGELREPECSTKCVHDGPPGPHAWSRNG